MLLKIAAVGIVLVWVLLHSQFVETWLWGVSGGEIAGLKFQRAVVDEATAGLEAYLLTVTACQPNQDGFCLDKTLGEAAIVRASRVAPAIVGARILWVDDKPAGNASLKGILEKMGMHVVSKNWTQEALNALKVSPYDVIITNVWRPKDPDQLQRALTVCHVHYFDFPRGSETEWTQKNSAGEDQAKDPNARDAALERFNTFANQHAAAGYALADEVLADAGDDDTAPQIVFFTAEHARVARPFCGYRITNRADVLLNSIVSILEQRYYKRLASKPWASKASAE
jgi:CheY-like chemotaxis protein